MNIQFCLKESSGGVQQPKEHAFDVFEHCVQAQATASLLVRSEPVADPAREWLRSRARGALAEAGRVLDVYETLPDGRSLGHRGQDTELVLR